MSSLRRNSVLESETLLLVRILSFQRDVSIKIFAKASQWGKATPMNSHILTNTASFESTKQLGEAITIS